MAAGQFNILADQGANYVLYFLYETDSGDPIDISSYTGRMQVRRSTYATDILVGVTGDVANGTLRGGGSTGSYKEEDGGVIGVGGIFLNASLGGVTGAGGSTGGVYISIDSSTMANCPHGRHVYDCELIAGDVVTRVLQGRFEVRPEVTR